MSNGRGKAGGEVITQHLTPALTSGGFKGLQRSNNNSNNNNNKTTTKQQQQQQQQSTDHQIQVKQFDFTIHYIKESRPITMKERIIQKKVPSPLYHTPSSYAKLSEKEAII